MEPTLQQFALTQVSFLARRNFARGSTRFAQQAGTTQRVEANRQAGPLSVGIMSAFSFSAARCSVLGTQSNPSDACWVFTHCVAPLTHIVELYSSARFFSVPIAWHRFGRKPCARHHSLLLLSRLPHKEFCSSFVALLLRFSRSKILRVPPGMHPLGICEQRHSAEGGAQANGPERNIHFL